MTLEPTPYENFLRQTVQDQKQELDRLYSEFAHSNPLRKRILKREIQRVSQNIELISKDVAKYSTGLDWLRERSKERDEKAEHLKEVTKEEIEKATGAARPVPTAASKPVPPSPARPTVGTQTGAHQVTTPISRPSIGTPVGSAQAQPVVPRPVTPVPKPVVGPQTQPQSTPQKPPQPSELKKTTPLKDAEEKKTEEASA